MGMLAGVVAAVIEGRKHFDLCFFVFNSTAGAQLEDSIAVYFMKWTLEYKLAFQL